MVMMVAFRLELATLAGKLIEIRHYKVIDYKNEIVIGDTRVLKRSSLE